MSAAALIVSLALTLLLELPLARLWGLRGHDLATAALAQVLTNPPAVLLYALTLGHAAALRVPVMLLLEAAAVAAEGVVYARCTDARRPWLLSLCANGCSWAVGLVLRRFGI